MLNVLILLTKIYDMHEHIRLVGFNDVRWFINRRELSRSMILGSPLDFNLLTQRRCQLFWTLLIFKSSHYILLHNAFVFSFSIFSSLGFRCCWNSAVGLSIAFAFSPTSSLPICISRIRDTSRRRFSDSRYPYLGQCIYEHQLLWHNYTAKSPPSDNHNALRRFRVPLQSLIPFQSFQCVCGRCI